MGRDSCVVPSPSVADATSVGDSAIKKDPVWLKLDSFKIKAYDLEGNRRRALWLSRVRLDDQGCWIWVGEVSNQGAPRFYLGGQRRTSPAIALFMLWFPERPTPRRLTRVCRKPLCVRPACLSTHDTSRANEQTKLIEKAGELYRSGVRPVDIERQLGPLPNLHRWIAKFGWRFGGRVATGPKRYANVDRQAVRAAVEAGEPISGVAARFAVPADRIYQWRAAQWK